MKLQSLTRLVTLGRTLTSNTIISSFTRNANNGISSSFPSILCRQISDVMKKTLDETVHKNEVVLFMKGTPELPECGFSRAVVQIFQVQGVDFSKIKTFNVLEDNELRQGVKEYSQWPTVPQVYIKGEFVGGCDIMLNMHQSGELEELLLKQGLIPEEKKE
ncbi:19394_t:CDS:2 [Funneliformis geosporum]|uniref:Monothiol glutaredoxin-5, mitochondrial n=1 Tax=Funneliformis geosporum TaxID=1117311 RepID=A0A9W4SG18_9GLOM|nr:19394_t:CDS:2 [Funneliformis geosporum]CAI2167701.1 11315_t:CDS:2 [Funneliformis geosporum]